MPKRWAIIAGGGTAGHAVAGLAVARELVARGHDPSSIEFVASRRGSEVALLADEAFPTTLLPGRGINERRLTLANLAAAVSLSWGVLQGVLLVLRRRPAVVLALGGYAALPGGVGAVVGRRRLVLADSNIVPGASNRVVGRFARASAVTFPGTPLPRAVVTGNPVRPEILAIDRSEAARAAARQALGIPDGPVVVAAFGGSLGSRRINTAVFDLVRDWADREDIAIHHVVGRRDWTAVRNDLPVPHGLHYTAVEYEHHMELLLTAADVAVTRAGGSTLAELGIAGVPAVLVPLPIASEAHQTANAAFMVRQGAAVAVVDHELTGERLGAELGPIVTDGGRLASMAVAMAGTGHRDAAARVADLLETHAR